MLAPGLLAGCGTSGRPTKVSDETRTFVFWPQFPLEPHIQFLKSFSGSEDVSPDKEGAFSKLVFGSEASDKQGIQKPYGVAFHKGKIYVCDIRNASLTVLDLAKKQTRLVGVSGANRIKHPVAVAAADDGRVYVADNERGVVVEYDTSERYSRLFGHEGLKPVAVAVHGKRLYVANITAHTVEVFDRDTAKQIQTIGEVGDENGQFRVPLGLATDKDGNLYVVDMFQCRVQKFGPDGAYISAFGSMGDHAGTFIRPKHVAVDVDGVVYVVDAAFQNVQMFDDQFQTLMAFGAAGDHPGAMNMPVGVAVSEEGLEYFKDYLHPGFEAKRLVIVSNQFGDGKVSVYAMGVRKESVPLADLSARAVKISTGTGGTSEEITKMQTVIPGDTPPPDGGTKDAAPPEGTTPTTPPSSNPPTTPPSTPPKPPGDLRD
jgi:DNA-binding beta-propeller fold protein YncE